MLLDGDRPPNTCQNFYDGMLLRRIKDINFKPPEKNNEVRLGL